MLPLTNILAVLFQSNGGARAHIYANWRACLKHCIALSFAYLEEMRKALPEIQAQS
jgi:hypothetical protein